MVKDISGTPNRTQVLKRDKLLDGFNFVVL